MGRVAVLQNAFTAGEIAPRLKGRSDAEWYRNACEEITNFVPLRTGGARRRPGTRFVREVPDSTKATRVISMETSAGDFTIELSDQLLRFYQSRAIVGAPYTVATPYLEADLFELQFTQRSADELVITHRGYAPRILAMSSPGSWALSTMIPDWGPWLDENITATTVTASGATGSITITASTSIFTSTMVGGIFRIRNGSSIGYALISGYTSGTVVDATVLSTVPTAAVTTWSEGAWSPRRGWPRACAMFQQRAVFAGTTYQPMHIWATKTGDFDNFDPGTTLANEAWTFQLAAGNYDEIRWLASGHTLIVGTRDAEWQVHGGTDGPVTPSNVTARSDSTQGVAMVAPVAMNGAVIYVSASQKRVLALEYNSDATVFTSTDLSVLAEHIVSAKVVDMAFQREPEPVVWCVLNDGTIGCMALDRANGLAAWHRIETREGDEFESVARVPGASGAADELWVVVKRTIDGATKRYVEYFDTTGGYNDYLGVDCALVYDSTATDAITGLSHLAGEEVAILGDGMDLPAQTVASNQVSGLSPEVAFAEVGLAFTSTLSPVFPELVTQGGATTGRVRRYERIGVRIFESGSFKINGDDVDLRLDTDAADTAVPLRSGLHELPMLVTGGATEPAYTFTQDRPLPLEILISYVIADVEALP